jgi:hypothetical protein
MSSFRNWQGVETRDSSRHKSEREHTHPDEPEGANDSKHTKKVKIGFGCNVDVKVWREKRGDNAGGKMAGEEEQNLGMNEIVWLARRNGKFDSHAVKRLGVLRKNPAWNVTLSLCILRSTASNLDIPSMNMSQPSEAEKYIPPAMNTQPMVKQTGSKVTNSTMCRKHWKYGSWILINVR